MELNSKYEGLNLEDLSNFKSEASVQQWEGEDFRSGVGLSRYHARIITHSLLAESFKLQYSFAFKTRAQI
jgi:hypothetical protein